MERAGSKRRIDCYEPFSIDSLEDADEAWLGMDLAAVRDTCAAVVSVRRANGTVCVVPYFWLPEREAERQNKRVPYQQWSAGGFIRLTPGDVVDYDTVFKDLVAIVRRLGAADSTSTRCSKPSGLLRSSNPETGCERVGVSTIGDRVRPKSFARSSG